MGKKRGIFCITAGLLLIAAALLITVYNLWDARRAGLGAEKALTQLIARIPPTEAPDSTVPIIPGLIPDATDDWEMPDYILHPEMEMPRIEIDGCPYIGFLELPSLSLTLPVMDDWDYSRLRVAPCRYAGSAYLGNMVIAGHNYARHFGRLKELLPGDPVIFTDAEGNVFRYAVAELETLQKPDVEKMTAGNWDLTLFTCTVGGRERVTIRCAAQ